MGGFRQTGRGFSQLYTDEKGVRRLSLNPKHRTPYTYAVHRTAYSVHPTPYTLHRTPGTLQPTSCTLHRTLYTLHHTPKPTPYTLRRDAPPANGLEGCPAQPLPRFNNKVTQHTMTRQVTQHTLIKHTRQVTPHTLVRQQRPPLDGYVAWRRLSLCSPGKIAV